MASFDLKSLQEEVVSVNRVTKVVKKGRNLRFSVLVVLGDPDQRIVGFGLGKANEVATAKQQATESAKRNLFFIPLKESRTLFHDSEFRYGATKVLLRAAPPGTGAIAGGAAMRAILKLLGVKDVVAKCIGPSNPHNVLRATLYALLAMSSPELVRKRRGLSAL